MTNDFENHEHENHDEFVEHENGLSENTPKTGITGNLAEAWRTRPLFKFMVLLVAVFAVGVAGFSFLGGGNAPTDVAHLGRPPSIKEAPGGTVSPYMREQTELANKERSDQAVASGGSALPTPIGQTTDVGGFGAAEKKDDPLNELRAETETLRKQVQQQQAQQAQLQQRQQQQPEQFDNTLAEAMQQQMRQLLDGWTPKGIKTAVVIKPEDLKNEQKADAAAATAAANQTAEQTPRVILVNAGTVSYAQLLTEANSDVPGPILAQIVSGPLAGARAIGSFQVAMGYEKYLVMRFSIADKKGKDYQINAVALDPDTTLGGMATEVDERYFTRVILPAAAGFLQGMGEGVSQGNSTITNTGTTTTTTIAGNSVKYGIYNGLGQAAQTMGQFFQDQANTTKPLVRVAAGTPMGLFFVAPVYEPDTNTIEGPQNGTGTGNGVAGGNGQNQTGINPYMAAAYPGTTVPGYGNNNSVYGQQAVPYPNAGQPGYGYGSSYNGYGRVNNMTPTMNGVPSSPYMQNYGQ